MVFFRNPLKKYKMPSKTSFGVAEWIRQFVGLIT